MDQKSSALLKSITAIRLIGVRNALIKEARDRKHEDAEATISMINLLMPPILLGELN